MNRVTIIAQTRDWVRDNFLYASPGFALEEDTPLLGRGVIDSIGVIELVEFLQRTYDVAIGDGEITEPNLGTLGAVGDFVLRKLEPGSAGEDGRLHSAA